MKEKINLLDVIPCHSEHISAIKEGEEVILSFPRFKYSWVNRYLLPKGMSKNLHVRLDIHGAAVWELVDGKRTVSEIIEGLAELFQNEKDYEERIIKFLMQLHKDGFIKYLSLV